MRAHEVRSVEINAPFDSVFAFISDPRNLPKWTHAFESVTGSRARLRTPAGVADIHLTVDASIEAGTIDWIMTFADGSIAAAYSRVTRASASRVVYTFVLNAPSGTLEQIEGALGEQVRTLETELSRLKELLTQP